MSEIAFPPALAGPAAALARNWWALALRGVLGIAFGVAAFAAPVAVLVSLALLFAAYLLVDGVFALVAALRAAEHHERWGALAAEGVLGLVMGALAAAFPGGAVLGFVLVTAAWALVSGALMLTSSFRLRGAPGRVWMGLAGAVSILWGIVLAAAPLAGAVVLTWWLGAYAVLFGIALLALGLHLRPHGQRQRA